MKNITKLILLTIIYYLATFNLSAQNTNGGWTLIGPINFPKNVSGQINGIGRVTQMKFNPTDPQKIYVACVGGLFVSRNGGTSYSRTGTDNLPISSCASICIDSINENNLYIGLGDGNYYSRTYGIYKSTNGGNTWSPSNTGIGDRLALDILMVPGSSNTLIAATDDGIWKSTDAGATWVVKKSGGAFRNMVFKSGSATVLYAVTDNTFWRSTNAGDTWTQISSVNPGANGNGGYIAVTPANVSTVYVGFVGTNDSHSATPTGGVIYRSTDGGSTFTLRKGDTQPCLQGYSANESGQGAYNWALGADRANANTLYAVGHCVWKSTNGGTNWTKLTDWPAKCHTDMHQIFVSPYNNNKIYNANDGGIFVSTDGGNNWTPEANGLSCSEMYHLGQDNTKQGHLHAGLQDNGANYISSNVWYCNGGGDETNNLNFDYANPANLYRREGEDRLKDEAGPLPQSVYLGVSNPNGNARFAFTKQNINLGYYSVDGTLRRSTNLQAAAPSWTVIKTFAANVKALAVSPTNTAEVYAVLDNSQVYRSSNATAASPTFSLVSTLPAGTNSDDVVMSIYKANTNILYITASNNVFRSTNKAAAWTDITGVIPSTQFRGVLVDPYSTNEAVYVATSLGVYYKNSSIGSWQSFSNGLPTVSIISGLSGYFDSMANSRLRVSFYGRGIWESPLYSATSGGCASAFEPNETQTTSKAINLEENISAAISSATDVDFFKITIPASTGTITTITVNLTGPLGQDYDLFIYNSAGTQIGSGESTTSAETVILPNLNLQPGTYFIKVIGYGGANSSVCYNIRASAAFSGFTASDKKIIQRFSGKALDDLGSSTADGAPIGQWPYNATSNQLWQLTDLGNGYFKIINKFSGKALDNAGSLNDGTGVVQNTYTGSNAQQWQVIDVGGGYFKMLNRLSGKALDNPGASTVDGGQMTQFSDNGSPAQQWLIGDGTLGVPRMQAQSNVNNFTETESDLVQLIPNPAVNQTNIIIQSTKKMLGMIYVFDASGKMIMMRKQELMKGVNKVNMNVGGFVAGVYQVVVLLNEKRITKKLVIE